jgi:hypothetical protein
MEYFDKIKADYAITSITTAILGDSCYEAIN